MYVHVARKHTGKVGTPRSLKSPPSKSNGHASKEQSRQTQPSVDAKTSANGDDVISTTPSPAKDMTKVNQSPQSTVAMAAADSTQNGDTVMDTSADSTNNVSGGEQSPMTTGEATPTTALSADEKTERDATKTKPKIHPFFGMIVQCVSLSVSYANRIIFSVSFQW